MGMILAVRQDAGGADSIALLLRKVAKLPIPFGSRNFRSCGGSGLAPLLFFAL